ncbi:MAG: flagellar biosynthetic protein FliO [candidate division Zixibacteria bacterium]|nr:flagellar biosynthetic protein FliO [candidate division Zixibacteria bacterium]
MKLIAVVLVLIPLSAYAQDTLSTMPQVPDVNYSPGIASIIFKLIVSLIIIVGLIYFTVFMLKKIGSRTMPNGNDLIKIVGKSYLTPKQSLYIVKLGMSYSVLGVGDNSVNLIKELSTEEVASFQTSAEKPKGFQNVLRSVLKR